MTSPMTPNSPLFPILLGILCLFGLVLIFRVFRTGLPGFDQLTFTYLKSNRPNADQNAGLGSSQFKNLLLQTITIPIVTFLVLLASFLYQLNAVLDMNRWSQHSDQVLIAESRVHRHILETESNLRGYILTGIEDHANQFNSNLKVTPKLFAELKDIVRDNSEQQETVDRIAEYFSQWSISAEKAYERRKKNQISLSSEITDRTHLMNRIRSALEHFEVTEIKYKADRWLSTQAAADNAKILIVALSVLGGLFLSLAGGHQLRKLSHNYSGLLQEVDQANKYLEQKVQDRTLELTATNKELEAFCYSVSHDLRAPLRGIDGFSQILTDEYQGKIDENGIKYLNYIRQGVQKMGILIDDLLNLSRLTRIEVNFKTFDISQLAQEIFTALYATDPQRKVTFKGAEPFKVEADPGLIRVALENLLSNAIKYTAMKDSALIEFGITETDKGTAFFVRDNGVGFDMKYYNKLFNVFQRLHDNAIYKGTGIGLATVKRVVARHGGEIWAESVPDQATTFYFTLTRKAVT